ncbi:hypothetical protein ACTOS9_22050 (plasmid) [Bacillus subtilis]|uniref:Rok N-terminal oligomerisation domain-containing protein n=1 Tax=Bacillus subtilis TaxID=1423 RepID=A0A8I1WK46_BACIU|nr:hypothetical protein [Bacillus subtilis]MBO3796480.1 hypothetical protein [Bacillus subtilis]MCM3191260.1 hypothetical protein [Bacillus subtilis]WEY82926.1 hypothetical protein P5633_00250 [Bacillus subtilis]
MINERKALKQRLEQLNEAEIEIIKMFRKEREGIYNRLREIDNYQDKLPNLRELAAQEKFNKLPLINDKEKPSQEVQK